MIKIKHIKAHLPFKNCELSFMLRKKQLIKNNHDGKQGKIKLTQDYVDLDINCSLQLGEFVNCQDPLQLCVIAVKGNEKIFVGSIELNIKQSICVRQTQLSGIPYQDGYLAYSFIKDCPIKLDRSMELAPHKNKSASQKKPTQRGFIKYKNSSSSSTYSQSQMSFQNKSGCESPFRKNKQASHFDENSKVLDELFHEVLQQQLYNQRAWNKIQENQIFQLRYKHRIDTLLRTTNS